MKKSKPFRFREFEIIQDANPQKVGTDSMLLGAWTKGNFNRVLDIGTGTGILALMMAQKSPNAMVTAIEPNEESLKEATLNFNNSTFSDRILAINTALQQFGSIDKFDLIICNPPYFNGTFLSEKENRNTARHNLELPCHELFEGASENLTKNGRFNLIIPFEIEREYIERAFDTGLFIQEITHTIKSNGDKKRSLISFGFEDAEPIISEILVKDESNKYSAEYIEMTKAYYTKNLNK